MNDITWWQDGPDGLDWENNRFKVQRHGEGRKYWEAHYPDGTHVDTFTTRQAARESCGVWAPDPSLVALVDQVSIEVDDAAAAAAAHDSRVPLEPIHGPINRDSRAAALRNIATLVDLRHELEDELRRQVAVARDDGGRSYWSEARTWPDIGKALGVSKQAAAKKYGGSNS